MIRSMTGFGAADGLVGGSRVSVELRTVNHRFFSPSIKLPTELSRWEPEVREALRKSIARGHVTVSARTQRTSSSGSIDEQRFAGYVAMLLTSSQPSSPRNLEPRGTGGANVAEILQQNPGISSIPLREPPAGCPAA